MTKAARTVLEDCRNAVAELTPETSASTWRRRWVTSVVLLRAVGHVLSKVDARASREHHEVIASWWNSIKTSKPAPEIFWLLIEQERNSILKEHQSLAVQRLTTTVAAFDLTSGKRIEASAPSVSITMETGHFRGRSQQELLEEAIQWWEKQLEEIDAAVVEQAP
jgi:hypothetical protein